MARVTANQDKKTIAANMANVTEAHVTEHSAEQLEVLAKFKLNFAGILAIGIGVGIPIGFGAGVLWTKKSVEKKFVNLFEIEVASLRKEYQKAQENLARKQKPDPRDIVRSRRYTPEEQAAIDEVNAEVEAEQKAEEEARNVFRDVAASPWDYAKEVKSRTSDRPYVIHVDEWESGPPKVPNGEIEWQQGHLVYWGQDDILVDEQDQIIDADRDSVVGEENLTKFGHGSNDPNIVYVRNEYMTIDIEIVYTPGSYVEEVHKVRPDGEEPRRHRQLPSDD